MATPVPASRVSSFSHAKSATSSRAALNLIRLRLRTTYVHDCTVEDALRVLEVMPKGKDCVVRRFVDDPPKYKVKVRGHADDDVYDETTMFSLMHSGTAHFVSCQDTIDSFFRIRTPPQLQQGPLAPLFLHAASRTTKEHAIEQLKAHYFANAAHPERKQLPHVVLLMHNGEGDSRTSLHDAGNSDITAYYIDPAHANSLAVLAKRISLVRASSRFMHGVVIPTCSSPSSAASETHVVDVPASSTPAAALTDDAPPSSVALALPTLPDSDSDPPDNVSAPDAKTGTTTDAPVHAAPSEDLPDSPAAAVDARPTWPSAPAPPPPPSSPRPPPVELQSAPGTMLM